MEPWRCAYASVVGTSHEKTGAPCQDAGRCRLLETTRNGPVLLAAASDGAGTAPRSHEGATLVIERFFGEFGRVCEEEQISIIDREFVISWMRQVRAEISDRAQAIGLRPRDFACTALGAVVGPMRSVFFQVGDGAIVICAADDELGEYGIATWPQHGEFANSTNFVTDQDADVALQVEVFEGKIDDLAIFTDGIERLVLDFSTKAAHAPFFRPLFAWLAAAKSPPDDGPSPALIRYLSSEQVNNRTDDDKTLILATRRVAPACEPAHATASGTDAL